MNKKNFLFLLTAIVAILLTGCWSRTEINATAIILGAGVDWMENGNILLTLQIARSGSFSGGESGAGGQETGATWVLSAEGKTIADAERDLSMRIPRKIYWNHCAVLVIGEEIARKELDAVVNFFELDAALREMTKVVVARGRAKDVLQTSSSLEKSSSTAMVLLIKKTTAFDIMLEEFVRMLGSKGIDPVLPGVETKESGFIPEPGKEKEPQEIRQVQLSGAAVFKDDKLVGWLNPQETKAFLWLKGEDMKGMVVIPSPFEAQKYISYRILHGSSKVVPEYDGEHLLFNVKVTLKGAIVEQQSSKENLDLNDPEKINILESEIPKVVKHQITLTLEKAQKEFGADIFGFGETFHATIKKSGAN